MIRSFCQTALLIVAALLLISGCAAQGAKRIPADRFDYNAAIANSATEQMLLNIVRSRYLEVPVFLSVSSVLTQYEYDRSVGVGTILEFGSETTDRGTGNANLGFAERPTITYLPVCKDKNQLDHPFETFQFPEVFCKLGLQINIARARKLTE